MILLVVIVHVSSRSMARQISWMVSLVHSMEQNKLFAYFFTVHVSPFTMPFKRETKRKRPAGSLRGKTSCRPRGLF